MWKGLIHEEVLRQCDGLDGAMDGIIEDPNFCKFRPEALLCANDTATDCLTLSQVEQVIRVFSPLYGEHGKLVYPAMQPGSEVMAVTKLYAGKPFSYSEVITIHFQILCLSLTDLPQDWFKYVVYDPSWNAASFNIHDAAVAEALNPSNIRTWPDNLSSFRRTGGKMLVYHGGQDNQITSFNTERFYKHLLRGSHASATELDHFFRFFRVPGMFHCNSGPGAWVIGQGGGPSAKGVPFDSPNNVLAAL